MTERELVIEMSSSRELCAAIEELMRAQVLSSNVGETPRRIVKRLDAGLTEREVQHVFPQDGHIGLDVGQMQPLLNAASDLLRNVMPGMVGLLHKRADMANLDLYDYQSDAEIYGTLDEAFNLARKDGLSAKARIVYDDGSGKGKLTVEHPLIEGYSPDFDIRKAIEIREMEGGRSGVRANRFGGLGLIQHGVKDSLQLAGIRSEPVQTHDDEESNTRKVWFEFRKG